MFANMPNEISSEESLSHSKFQISSVNLLFGCAKFEHASLLTANFD